MATNSYDPNEDEDLKAMYASATCGKQAYVDLKAARTAINRRLRSRRNRPDGLRTYRCPYCSFYHLSHITKR